MVELMTPKERGYWLRRGLASRHGGPPLTADEFPKVRLAENLQRGITNRNRRATRHNIGRTTRTQREPRQPSTYSLEDHELKELGNRYCTQLGWTATEFMEVHDVPPPNTPS